jgi:hypothetical protein
MRLCIVLIPEPLLGLAVRAGRRRAEEALECDSIFVEFKLGVRVPHLTFAEDIESADNGILSNQFVESAPQAN